MIKKASAIITICVMLVALMFTLSGCSGTELSGTYVNPVDDSKYVVFDGKTATFYEDGVENRSGTFTESAKTSRGDYLLRIYYEDSSTDERYWLDEKKETIYTAIIGEENTNTVGDVAFIKESLQ